MKDKKKNVFLKSISSKLNSKRVKRSLVTNVLSIIFIVAIIFVNIGATALAAKYPLSIDLTSNQDYSLTTLASEHEDFIKSIAYDVKITACFAESDITGGVYEYYLKNSYTYEDATGGKYFTQMQNFLEDYAKLNPKITIEYSSPFEPAFAVISQKYSETINYGSVLVECTFTNSEGNKISRYKIVKVDKIYAVEDLEGYASYGYNSYTITGSTLEPSITQALYSVTSEASTYASVLTGHGCAPEDALKELLVNNNYEISTISSLLTEKIDEKSEFLIISSPTSDFSNDEITAIKNFLKTDVNTHRQKSLIYIPGVSTKPLETFEEFLNEWGIDVYNEVVYATDKSKYSGYPYMALCDTSTDESTYSIDLNTESPIYSNTIYRAVKMDVDDYHTSLLNFPGTAVGKPIEEFKDGSTWTTADATVKGQLEAVCVAVEHETYTDENFESVDLVSNVMVVSSPGFFAEEALSSSAFSNADFTVAIFNKFAGIDESDSTVVEFVTKKITTDSFADTLVGSNAPKVVNVIFLIIAPAMVVTLGIVIWVRRKRA